jgi:ferredoxin
VVNRLAGSSWNPLYQSGTIAVVLFLVLLVTGLWLLLFYRIGSPWTSVAGITANPWTGNWVRGLHRYASDAVVVAVVVHAVRMAIQGRHGGPRALAWVTGVLLLGVVMVCGWTGYVLVWDTFGETLARDGARLIDALPVLSEPIGRIFTGETAVPPAFFFINLFLHVALPLGVGLGLWLHVSRVARPVLLPPRGLRWAVIGLLAAVAILWPLPMLPEANPFQLPATLLVDPFFGFWLLVPGAVSPSVVWAVGLAVSLGLVSVPWLVGPRGVRRPAPSWVDEDICTGCHQCSLDCPWEAISMVPRRNGRAEVVARVDPSRCVSCGICAGSCAPMGVGPPGRTGRDQWEDARRLLGSVTLPAETVVAITCARGVGADPARTRLAEAGIVVRTLACTGNLHTSVIELLLRRGVAGVAVVACPPRDCWNREGATWLEQRMFHDREAELQARVDRRRVRLLHGTAGEVTRVIAELRQFRSEVSPLERATELVLPEDLTLLCEPALSEPGVRQSP